MTTRLDVCIDPLYGVVSAAILLGCSGIPAVLISSAKTGRVISAATTVLAAATGLFFSLCLLFTPLPVTVLRGRWSLPFGQPELSVDPLTALFLVPLFIAAICSSLYCLDYLAHSMPEGICRRVLFLNGILPGSMAMVLLSRHTVLLLMAWEVMALSSWLLLMTDQEKPDVQRSGMIYLLFTHTGTIFLLLLFALLKHQTGDFLLPASGSLAAGSRLTPFILIAALIGFGAKAGIMPLHIWLPGAHANAPSHASALMSGIMLKIGIYGIIRTAISFSETPVWFGWLLLLAGAVSALAGILLASAQQDLKRLLAYSSIENIGIICIGLGMLFIGFNSGNSMLTLLGGAAALIHIINHALFKPLLFFGSGVVIHATGSRVMDRMGGVARLLPRTTALFMVGSLAICALPPLNGFVGEFFLYTAAFTDGISDRLPLLVVIPPLLALVGAVAVVTFVKLYGAIFSGVPRGDCLTEGDQPEPLPMLLPMLLLALLCLAGGLWPPLLLQLVRPTLLQLSAVQGGLLDQTVQLVPLGKLAMLNIPLLLLAAICFYLVGRLPRRRGVSITETWGCGYLAPTGRIQYTGSSFTALLSGIIFGKKLSGRQLVGGEGIFATPGRLLFHGREWLLDRVILPGMQRTDRQMAWFKRIQHGHLHLYILYILITLLSLIVWSRTWP